MLQVIPAILEQSWEEIQKKVELIKPYVQTVQLDVMDGVFVPNTTYNETEKLQSLDIDLELHLMIEKPELTISKWMLPNASRVIVHFEAADNLRLVIDQIRKAGKEVGVAINPETTTYALKEYLPEIDLVLVMGVNPGFSGQSFQRDVLEKIKELRQLKPELQIAVDGGVDATTRDQIEAAGADMISAASAIWKSEDIGEAVKQLQGAE